MKHCYHCGDACSTQTLVHKEKYFCCTGCKTVFDILHDNDLSYYYDLESTPGTSPKLKSKSFDFLDNQEIQEKLIEFNDERTQVVSFTIPTIHCSSCIWVLENLNKLCPGVLNSQVNFPEKTVRIVFSKEKISLKKIVLTLTNIGYEPSLSLDSLEASKKQTDYTLIYKIGVAGFAFGNIMFLSFPEYFEVQEFWLDRFKHLFRWLMLLFSIPVVFYSGSSYFVSAYKGLRSGFLNIDVPIALGISVLFLRSIIEIVFDIGTGFLDSLSGLVFFLLVGKYFQQRTYAYLSFERDYKSYFPIAVTRLVGDKEEQIQVYKIKKGDRIVLRNEEILPVDGILQKGSAHIDYSFVTGESDPVEKTIGEKLFAGGRQKGGVLEVEVLKPVAQSYLTQLWSNEVFTNRKQSVFQSLTDKISKRFTLTLITIAFVATLYWLFIDIAVAVNVFTSVLIIACPCAIALAAPFTLGNILRIFGNHKLYLKEASVIETMAAVDTVVFDKTGTLTQVQIKNIEYLGAPLTQQETAILYNALRGSNHPLSRQLYQHVSSKEIIEFEKFEETPGKGIHAKFREDEIKIGAETFVKKGSNSTNTMASTSLNTKVHLSINEKYKGCFVFKNAYRSGVKNLISNLKNTKQVYVLSGDNEGERETLEHNFNLKGQLHFNKKPEQKLQFIENLQKQGRCVMMVGDGLNDAGALAQSDVGIVVAEDVNVFSPASDGIIDASKFNGIFNFFEVSLKGIRIIKWSFLLSLCYNVVGLYFAVTGQLSPLIAAILMPLSSISIVVFTTVSTNILGKKYLDKK